MAEGLMPAEEMIDGVLIFAAGLVLITPGFLTDAVGFLLLVPPTRRAVKTWLWRRFQAMADRGDLRVIVSQPPGAYDWRVLVYAVLSLTVIRMLPVFLAAFGVGLRSDAKLFLGWFGPRGLASIVFLVIVLHEKLPGHDILAATTVATVVLSIIGHGVTANPLSAAFGAHETSESGGQG